MLLLLLFAVVAGAGTALSPCVLPILPAVLGAGVTGGRKRPLGIVIGLTLSFALSAVALVYLIDALGLPNDIQRIVAIVVLLVFGVALLIPPVSDRLEAWISRLVGAPRMERSEGFGGGLVLGGALGLAYFPCAGPILAGVITVSAAQDFTVGRLAVALAYAMGSGIVLYAIMRLGRRFTDRLKPIQGRIQMAMGAVMIVVAIAMTANLDTKFQSTIADDLPDFLVNPTESLEQSDAVASELQDVRGGGGHELASEGGGEQALAGRKLPVVGPAGEFTDTQQWFNTPDDQPLSIAELNAEGKTVLVDFWTYTCINCIRTLPYVKAWADKYEQDGLVVVGVHSPEFPFEKDAGNVADAIASNDIRYPVVQDNELGTWNSFHNQYWPAKYLIDPDGNVRYTHFGEGDYETTEKAIRSVLAENGAADLGGEAKAKVEVADPNLATPETYLGSARAVGWVNGQPPQGSLPTGSRDFGSVGDRILKALPPNGFAYQGRWDVTPEDATAEGNSRIDARFQAAGVYLVLGSPDEDRSVRVLLDGKPISAADAGSDVGPDGTVTVGDQRLYRLVQLDKAEDHVLSLEFDDGISGYAFTFG
jgi:cytochrome c biogenesis protein CcdA/thiol-disulfide isomerase/thioredoxin